MANSYKDTMNLPQTDFSMRANLPQNEPKRLEKWAQEDIYGKVLEKNKDGKPFILHDGPPYANGPIHIGHSFNKILKDFVNKSHAQRGFYTPYIPGWDCHGQPIEHMVEVTLGPEKMAAIDQPTLRRLCREWAERYVNIQREGFKRLGVNGDWEHPYLTFTPNYESGNVEVFKDMYLQGSIYRGRKPIHWCSNCHTALAEAEIEYSDEVSPSIFVNFKLDVMPGIFEANGAEGAAYVLIWTTTPWTLPANAAVSLAPDAAYVMVQAEGKNMIMAKDLVEQVAQEAGWADWALVSDAEGNPVTVAGKQLCGLTYTCPIRQDLQGSLIYGDHVTLDTGTGAVHTAPGHGQDDYLVGLEFDIPVRMPVDDNGVLTAEAGPFEGLSTDDANPKIIEWLREQGTLVAEKKINHSYPHCWRCHKPVIFRATEQWFVSMDENALREDALRIINTDVEWVPAWAKNRIGSMVADRPDWCISRQRSWGVPIPVFRCEKCGEVVATEESFDAVIKLFDQEGADAWFTKKPSEYLPRTVCCEKCGSHDLVPEKDILDVWWESGVSHTSVLKHRAAEGVHFPADLYLEGSDQHRGWFQSSLLTSVGCYGVAPYKSVMHCGFTMDEQGRKMSKSLGNGVDPEEVMSTFGADVLRLWVSSVDYSQDVSISDNILKQVSDAYRRIRNTFRFLLGNLDDFDFERDAVTNFDDLEPFDRYVMVQLADLVKEVENAYETYRFNGVYRAIYDFANELSAVYMDEAKDRLYAEAPNSPRRRAVQTVLMNVLEALVRLVAPILSFTADEVWECYPPAERNREGRPFSAQLAGWPHVRDFVPALPDAQAQEQLRADFAQIMAVRDVVTKALEDARTAKVINKSQEAAIALTAPADVAQLLERYGLPMLEELFIVATVRVEEGDQLSAAVSVAEGEKCPRCWNIRALGGNPSHPDVCERCGDALDALEAAE
ncbi:isoleucine--tRNA ligase [Parvibacter caecicola]|uniref:Isoleucine--tRNA ligase n=1 Tax=Parvibacter caecicola TaxID=747645 RepID=A0A7W5D0F5_9ACTN|nr:isoleucine--tRNA ligase [Parvibacter caecicola]MBB3170618.1 isoleucyl-tRNA synthetase [Parvibacter caecicola]MCR2041421.1 isoleucine--tRNA ligase [Parvibacter caecicola]RNL12005.1 isoleucine--tRNA ligase [Parvibacter caecicola]